jgi:hypothetical protein
MDFGCGRAALLTHQMHKFIGENGKNPWVDCLCRQLGNFNWKALLEVFNIRHSGLDVRLSSRRSPGIQDFFLDSRFRGNDNLI